MIFRIISNGWKFKIQEKGILFWRDLRFRDIEDAYAEVISERYDEYVERYGEEYAFKMMGLHTRSMESKIDTIDDARAIIEKIKKNGYPKPYQTPEWKVVEECVE